MNNIDKNPMLELDDLDLMLARELELDARQSTRALSGKLAVSETTVRKRLQRLLAEKVITIITMSDARSLGFPTTIRIGLSVRAGKADEVAEYLRFHQSIKNIVLTIGRYDIIISAVFRKPNEVIGFIDGDLSHIPYLVKAEPIFVLDIIKTSWKYLNDGTDRYQEPTPRDLDELDINLAKELELSPREGVTNLAKKLGVNRKLVSKRLKALVADNVVRVVSIAKPSFFGLNIQVFIFMKIELGKVRSVANRLINEGRVRHILITAGRFDLFLSVAFRDMEEMSDFLRNHLGNYPEVVSHETLIRLAYPKRSYSVLT